MQQDYQPLSRMYPVCRAVDDNSVQVRHTSDSNHLAWRPERILPTASDSLLF
jgi:hypothetical protein